MAGTNTRRFTRASSEYISLSAGGVTFTGSLTIAAIVKRASNAIQHRIYDAPRTSGAVQTYGIELFSANELRLVRAGTAQEAPTIQVIAADGWTLVAVTCASGTSTPRYHRKKFSGGAWTHEDGAATLAGPAAPSSSNIARIGATSASSPSAFADMQIAVLGIFNAVLSDADIETLDDSLSNWTNLTPTALYRLDQDSVSALSDLTGNGANETTRVGTSVVADVPTGFVWDGVIYQKSGILTTEARGLGSDISTFAEIGVGISTSALLGSKTAIVNRAGVSISPLSTLASDIFVASEAGLLASALISSGVSARQANSKTGKAIVDVFQSGGGFGEDDFGTVNFGEGSTGGLSGADVHTAVRTGLAASPSVLAGSQVFTISKTGKGISLFVASAVDVAQYTEIALVVSNLIVSGPSAYPSPKSGTFIMHALNASGADVFTAIEIGNAVSALVAGGADAHDAIRGGIAKADLVAIGKREMRYMKNGQFVVSALSASGLDVGTFNRLGLLTSAAVLAGADAATLNRLGAVISAGVASGLSQKANDKSGLVVVNNALIAGGDSFTASRAGLVISPLVAKGTSAVLFGTKTGTVVSALVASAADVHTAIRAGQAISIFKLMGFTIEAPSGGLPGVQPVPPFEEEWLVVSGDGRHYVVLSTDPDEEYNIVLT